MATRSPKHSTSAAPAPGPVLAATLADGASVAAATELIERRRFSRPIPIAQVIESTEADGWDLWHQWSESSNSPKST